MNLSNSFRNVLHPSHIILTEVDYHKIKWILLHIVAPFDTTLQCEFAWMLFVYCQTVWLAPTEFKQSLWGTQVLAEDCWEDCHLLAFKIIVIHSLWCKICLWSVHHIFCTGQRLSCTVHLVRNLIKCYVVLTLEQPLVDGQINVLAFSIFFYFFLLPPESFVVLQMKRSSRANVSFLLFHLSLLTWDLLQERKQESSRGVAEAPPKQTRDKPILPKRTLSPNMFLPEPLPVLLQCLPVLAHLLLVIGVQGHLFCDLWWQWITSLVGLQEAVWCFDEAFAFTFTAKVWQAFAKRPQSNDKRSMCNWRHKALTHRFSLLYGRKI